MHLTPPTPEFEDSWLAGLLEFDEEGRKGFWLVPHRPENIQEYMQRTKDNSEGKNLTPGWVPATTYWLIDDAGEFVAHVNIRHELNDGFKIRGGHIGYAVRPSARRKGYGSKMLELALEKAREMGLEKVLVTCDDDNLASIKIIEKNGGIFQDVVMVENELVRRYWILV